MTAPDFRAELQALVDAHQQHMGMWGQYHEDALDDAMTRARAALAEPVPFADKNHFVDVPKMVQPTDEELNDTYWTAWHEHLDRTNSVLHAAGLRAVLARWGRP